MSGTGKTAKTFQPKFPEEGGTSLGGSRGLAHDQVPAHGTTNSHRHRDRRIQPKPDRRRTRAHALPYLWARSHLVEARGVAGQPTSTTAAIFPAPQLLRRRSRCGEASLLRAVNSGRCTRKRATAILKVARDQLGVHQASGAASRPDCQSRSKLAVLLLLRAHPALWPSHEGEPSASPTPPSLPGFRGVGTQPSNSSN